MVTMEKTLLCLVFGGFCLLVGVIAVVVPGRVRRLGLRYYSGKNPLERFVPFGGAWMQHNEKEHLLSIRFSGVVMVVMGMLLLCVGIGRLWWGAPG